MRAIGRLPNESHAKRFRDYLYAKGIESQVDPDSHGSWEIWVYDDANLESARQALDQFTQNPNDPHFVEVSQAAVHKKKQDHEAKVGKRTRMVDGRTLFYAPPVPLGVLTILLIAISITAAIFTKLGEDSRFVQPLSITRVQYDSGYVQWRTGLPEIRQGEIWRLFTPMFLHFGILHIFFNMLWLRDLGSMVEARKSTWMLLVLVLVIAGMSNLAQYLVSGPNFGGMSGVVYGLLGYIWMQGKFDPASKLSLEPQTVLFMIVWFFLCLFGLAGPTANVVHAVGLGIGVAWGFIAARLAVAARHG